MKILLDDGKELKGKIVEGGAIVICAPGEGFSDKDFERICRNNKYLSNFFSEHNLTLLFAPRNLKWTVVRDSE